MIIRLVDNQFYQPQIPTPTLQQLIFPSVNYNSRTLVIYTPRNRIPDLLTIKLSALNFIDSVTAFQSSTTENTYHVGVFVSCLSFEGNQPLQDMVSCILESLKYSLICG